MSDTTAHSLTGPRGTHKQPVWLHGLYAAVWLYLFVSAINVMGGALKTLGQSSTRLREILDAGGNPIGALVGGVFMTAVVQSSSFTTSMIIVAVAAGQMNLETAVYAIMGANIGTSITNNLVSIGTMRIRHQFRRGYAAALMHGNVNLLTVAVLLPLEWISGAMSTTGHGVLMRFSTAVANWMGLQPIANPGNPVKVITRPVVDVFNWFGNLVTNSDQAHGILVAVLGLLLLFVSLLFMVTSLKGALLQRIEGLFSSILFRNDFMSSVVGVISTIFVQSSSVTTSLMVPLTSAGAVTLRRAFPFMLGCNLGTTVTGVIAASANLVDAAVSVAVCHIVFNVLAVLVWYPLRVVPIGLASWYARLAAGSRWYYWLFLVIVYFAIPGIAFAVTRIIQGSP